MVAAVQRNALAYNSTVLDTEDSEFSETADQIRSYHSVVVVPDNSRQGEQPPPPPHTANCCPPKPFVK